jgi:hypothetical protein
VSINWPSIVACGVASGLLGALLQRLGASGPWGFVAGAVLALAWMQTFKPFGARR